MQVSVIIPCYNAAPWIAASLRSVAEQTCPPSEIIVIDDGSTDGSLDAIQSSGVDVRLVQTNRANGAGARNAGIEVATGEWIAFQDADDLWYPHHLQSVRELIGSGDVAYLANNDHFHDANPNEVTESPLGWSVTEPQSGLAHHQFIELYVEKRKFAMASVVVKKDRLDEVGRFDPALPRRHDFDMWLRVIANQTWTLNPTADYAYRRDAPGSLSRSVANANYYHLKGMLKSRQHYQSPTMDRLLGQIARSAISSAFSFGDREDRQRAVQLGWPLLNWSDALPLWMGRLCPALFAKLHHHRNRTVPAYAKQSL